MSLPTPLVQSTEGVTLTELMENFNHTSSVPSLSNSSISEKCFFSLLENVCLSWPLIASPDANLALIKIPKLFLR